MVVLNLDHL